MHYTVFYYQCFELCVFFCCRVLFNTVLQLSSRLNVFHFGFCLSHQMHSLQRITLLIFRSVPSHLFNLYVFGLKCFTTVTSFAPDED